MKLGMITPLEATALHASLFLLKSVMGMTVLTLQSLYSNKSWKNVQLLQW
jgi:hypothetical protein